VDFEPIPSDDTEKPESENLLPIASLPERVPSATVSDPAWGQAKSSMKTFAKQGGRDNLRNAGRKYSRARGGRRAAAQNSPVGRGVASRVAGFLTDIATRGVQEAFRSYGLENLLGRPIESVLAGIINVLAPDGATMEGVIARKTVGAAINAIFARYEVEGDIDRLNEMDAPAVGEALQISISEFIFQRWMLELGKRVEEYAINAREAYKMEQEVKEYVSEATKFDLSNIDVLQTDWSSPESQRLIDTIFEEAYGFLEDAV
jgi:hypothetical protein